MKTLLCFIYRSPSQPQSQCMPRFLPHMESLPTPWAKAKQSTLLLHVVMVEVVSNGHEVTEVTEVIEIVLKITVPCE